MDRTGPNNPYYKHGASHSGEHWKRTRAYKAWIEMRRRVAHPVGKNACYAGVKIDPTWDDYTVFFAEMGEPEPGMSLDRKPGETDYGPGKCRWADKFAQARNRKWCVPPIGEAYARGMRGLMSQAEIAEVIGCSQVTVSNIQLGKFNHPQT